MGYTKQIFSYRLAKKNEGYAKQIFSHRLARKSKEYGKQIVSYRLLTFRAPRRGGRKRRPPLGFSSVVFARGMILKRNFG